VIFRRAQSQNAIVVTFDEDFADTRMYPTGTHAGVIRLRVWPTTIERTEALDRLLNTVEESNLARSLTIVDQRGIRVRKVRGTAKNLGRLLTADFHCRNAGRDGSNRRPRLLAD
jgi:hypothetical protein